MAEQREWVRLREYAGRLEADVDAGVLEEAGIPFVVKGPAIGIFGPGFSGPSPRRPRQLIIARSRSSLGGSAGAELRG